MDNISQQLDEIEVLKSIFEEQWEIDTETGIYSIEITKDVKLFITLNSGYPSSAPPTYDLLAPNLNNNQKELIKNEFQSIYEEECGNPILFQWIEKLKEIISLNENAADLTTASTLESSEIVTSEDKLKENKPFLLPVTHGSTIIDRKSVFQGHACTVRDENDVKDFMSYLMDNKKIAQATHNISAYRILLPNSIILQDCNDDGEAHASSRILHLLQILKLSNVMVVVSRWYGGIHLGPDRFKHINNAARQVLVQGGYIN
ncbi:hypothetical protein NQ318_013322 [Aromia moschata]|uniref:RWD domain-containing protein n=1 Tax=Aromia moschata TaxID=1265417 RepID=A0AAV8XYE0_9CUCU|nr:hypothetical protein NQ318_013322 [Aromia moschata]